MKVFLLIIFMFSSLSYACKYDNLTDKTRKADRDVVYDENNLPGTRIAWDGMKAMNKLYLSGTVDDVVRDFESGICNHFESNEFKQNYPNAKIEINKMDFKGYYATCTPKEACKGLSLEKEFSKVKPPKFPVTEDVPDPKTFHFSASDASSYKEGYIKARVKAAYPEYDGKNPPLQQFIKEKLDEAILEATQKPSLDKIDLNSDAFKRELAEQLGHARAGDEEKMAKRYKKLSVALDALMEIPYQGSNNFEKELEDALGKQPGSAPSGEYSIRTAKSGDDMNLIVRQGDDIVKVVGVDAKGLGVLNMTTRLDEYIDFVQGGGDISSMEDIFDVSDKAIQNADGVMKESMDLYTSNLQRTLELSGGQDLDIDQKLRIAHDNYIKLQGANPEGLMQMRAGALEMCGSDIKCLQNRITVVHNTLKEMEKQGIDGHFGDSCIGVEFWSRKFGVKKVLNIEEIK